MRWEQQWLRTVAHNAEPRANRVIGKVKSYNTRKGKMPTAQANARTRSSQQPGFGFITVPDFGRDIFVYNSHLIGRIGRAPR